MVGMKAGRYIARGGIPVYWIVNLVGCQVGVYTRPGPRGSKSRTIYKRARWFRSSWTEGS
jgi:hypothetical protein